jgi:hypothetical protein
MMALQEAQSAVLVVAWARSIDGIAKHGLTRTKALRLRICSTNRRRWLLKPSKSKSAEIFLWIQEQRFLADWLSAFDLQRR